MSSPTVPISRPDGAPRRRGLSIACRLFATALALAGLANTAAAQLSGTETATPHVSARLVASAERVAPGDTVTIGLAKQIIPGWHTYWRNPGDSGLATEIAWSLPPGAQAGDIQWPAPQRHAFGPVMNYGYEGEVTLLTDVTIPADVRPGEPIPLRADVDWLVCEEVCIPEQVTLTLEIPVGETTRGVAHPAIEQARAQLPLAAPWDSGFAHTAHGGSSERTELRLALATGPLPQHGTDVWFYPLEWGRIDHAAAQLRADTAEGLSLVLTPGEALGGDTQQLQGVLVITERSADGELRRAFTVDAPRRDALPPPLAEPVPAAASVGPVVIPEVSLATALLFALAGGLILNLMPCVFPVLAMKVLALVRHGQAARHEVRGHGLAYLGGVLASFALLGLVVLAVQAGGTRLGWGFQFQSPLFVTLIAWLLFAVGLNLSGVFSIGGGFAGVGQSLAARSGYAGSIFTGVLAAVVATPCTAPFMGAAIGFAMSQPPATLMAIFLALGLGLALPFVVLAWYPAALRRLPRPGAWMARFKQLLAFPMYAAAIWLVWVLALQTGADGVLLALAGMLALALAAWLFDATWGAAPAPRRLAHAAALALVVATLTIGMRLSPDPASAAPLAAAPGTSASAGAPAFEPYSGARLQTLREQGRPVFVNFTAAWCITCLVNERVAINQPAVADAFETRNVVYLKGDWTNQDAGITEVLARFGRSGVPLYLYYLPATDGEPVVLPQILTPDIVLRALAAAGSDA
ncbi:MAG: protein-disulfide reductase DsbD family protein [Rhodocyclaceae bacterium]